MWRNRNSREFLWLIFTRDGRHFRSNNGIFLKNTCSLSNLYISKKKFLPKNENLPPISVFVLFYLLQFRMSYDGFQDSIWHWCTMNLRWYSPAGHFTLFVLHVLNCTRFHGYYTCNGIMRVNLNMIARKMHQNCISYWLLGIHNL